MSGCHWYYLQVKYMLQSICKTSQFMKWPIYSHVKFAIKNILNVTHRNIFIILWKWRQAMLLYINVIQFDKISFHVLQPSSCYTNYIQYNHTLLYTAAFVRKKHKTVLLGGENYVCIFRELHHIPTCITEPLHRSSYNSVIQFFMSAFMIWLLNRNN